MWTKIVLIVKIIIGMKPKKTVGEVKEVIAAVKAARDPEGPGGKKVTRAEAEKVFKEALDVAEILVPGVGELYAAVKK